MVHKPSQSCQSWPEWSKYTYNYSHTERGSLNWLWEERCEGEALGHVSSRGGALLVLLEESKVHPGAEDTSDHQPGGGVGDDPTEREDWENGGHCQRYMLRGDTTEPSYIHTHTQQQQQQHIHTYTHLDSECGGSWWGERHTVGMILFDRHYISTHQTYHSMVGHKPSVCV